MELHKVLDSNLRLVMMKKPAVNLHFELAGKDLREQADADRKMV